MNYNKLDLATVNAMNECLLQSRTNLIASRSWDAVDGSVGVCSEFIGLLVDIVRNDAYNHFTDSSATVRRFINDTVGFILGESRSINIIVWEGLMDDISNYPVIKNQQSGVGTKGSGGNPFIKPYIAGRGIVAPSIGSDSIRKDILLYAHRDILKMWLSRVNGVDDMLSTITSLAKLYYSLITENL